MSNGTDDRPDEAYARAAQAAQADAPPAGNAGADDEQPAGPAPDEADTPPSDDPGDQAAQYKEDLQRLAAEFDNFRKRHIREVERARDGAADGLLVKLLEVVDNFERAMGQAPDTAETSSFVDGIRMVHSSLVQVLADAGLRQVPVDGQFDTNLHDAIHMQPADGAEEGQILEVAQKGYCIGDRVIRHAKVVVAGEQ